MVSRPALGLCPGRGSAGLDRAAWAPGCPAVWRGKVCLSVAGAPGISLLACDRDQRDGAVRPSPASRAEDGDSSVPTHAAAAAGPRWSRASLLGAWGSWCGAWLCWRPSSGHGSPRVCWAGTESARGGNGAVEPCGPVEGPSPRPGAAPTFWLLCPGGSVASRASASAGLGLCNVLTAATGGSDQEWDRFKENEARSDKSGCPGSDFVDRCSNNVA